VTPYVPPPILGENKTEDTTNPSNVTRQIQQHINQVINKPAETVIEAATQAIVVTSMLKEMTNSQNETQQSKGHQIEPVNVMALEEQKQQQEEYIKEVIFTILLLHQLLFLRIDRLFSKISCEIMRKQLYDNMILI